MHIKRILSPFTKPFCYDLALEPPATASPHLAWRAGVRNKRRFSFCAVHLPATGFLILLLFAGQACSTAPTAPPTAPVTAIPTGTSVPTLTPTPPPSPTPPATAAPTIDLPTRGTDGITEHRWANRSFFDGINYADPDLANGAPDTTECGSVFTAWAPTSSSEPLTLTLTYTAALIPTQVNIFQSGFPGGILRVEVLNSASGLGRLIYEGTAGSSTVCPTVLSIPVQIDFEVDTIFVTVAASENPTHIDAVELIGILQGFVDLPVFWRITLPETPISLAANNSGLVYLITDPDGLYHYNQPARDLLYAFDVEGNQLNQFSIPVGADLTDVDVDPTGNIVLLNATDSKFIVLSPEGDQLIAGGSEAKGRVAVSPLDGNIYVLNWDSVIRVYNSATAELLRELSLNDLSSYTGLAIDPQGHLYTIRNGDWAPELLQLDALTGEERDLIPLVHSTQVETTARNLTIDAAGNIYVLFTMNTAQIAVEMFASNGTLLHRFGKLTADPDRWFEGSFLDPRAIAVTPDGHFLLIADGYPGSAFLTAFKIEDE